MLASAVAVFRPLVAGVWSSDVPLSPEPLPVPGTSSDAGDGLDSGVRVLNMTSKTSDSFSMAWRANKPVRLENARMR